MLTLEGTKGAELTPEQREMVRTHLQEVLSSDAFRGGHRAQHFLQLVVERVLIGRSDSLRERMLGAEMFGRPIDYDTGNDAVVRVKASEVRRRLAQYYQGLTTQQAVQIGPAAVKVRWGVPNRTAANHPRETRAALYRATSENLSAHGLYLPRGAIVASSSCTAADCV